MKVQLTLDRPEYNALMKIASRTKMDAWFSVLHTPLGDLIYDIEDSKSYTLKNGISLLVEGMVSTDSDDYDLNAKETKSVNELFELLGIDMQLW